MLKVTKIYSQATHVKIKKYKCLNLTTHKVIESVHVKIDEFLERNKEQSNKEPKNYRNFMYYEPDTIPKSQALVIGQKLCQLLNSSIKSLMPSMPPMQLELQPVQPIFHLVGLELQLELTKSLIEETESQTEGTKSQIVEPKYQ